MNRVSKQATANVFHECTLTVKFKVLPYLVCNSTNNSIVGQCVLFVTCLGDSNFTDIKYIPSI